MCLKKRNMRIKYLGDKRCANVTRGDESVSLVIPRIVQRTKRWVLEGGWFNRLFDFWALNQSSELWKNTIFQSSVGFFFFLLCSNSSRKVNRNIKYVDFIIHIWILLFHSLLKFGFSKTSLILCTFLYDNFISHPTFLGLE